MKHLRRGPCATVEPKVSVASSGNKPENRCVTTIISDDDDDDDNNKTVIKMSRWFDNYFQQKNITQCSDEKVLGSHRHHHYHVRPLAVKMPLNKTYFNTEQQ